MKKIVMLIIIGVALMPLTGCQNKQQAGTVAGAALGGILGSQVGAGKGRTAAIIGGAVLGALAGSEIGRQMDENDELKAQQTLETAPTGQTTTWRNPDTGAEFAMTPTKTYKEPRTGQYCREYQTEVVVGGKTEHAYGTACRQPDGSWKIRE
jgi:surface antigen